MEPDFWRERWKAGAIAFHLAAPNPRLVEHASAIAPPAASRVLVPLCGKSVDLVHLAALGLEVVGVELVEDAARQFFAEQDLTPEISVVGPFTRYSHGGIAIFVGDFFESTPALLGGVFDAAFDRAAVIALPPSLRTRYATTLRSLLSPGAPVLIVLLTFDAPGGPPFSVSGDDLRALYPDDVLERVGSVEATAESPNLVARGATRVDEDTYALRLAKR